MIRTILALMEPIHGLSVFLWRSAVTRRHLCRMVGSLVGIIALASVGVIAGGLAFSAETAPGQLWTSPV
jgi:hypothetical protein